MKMKGRPRLIATLLACATALVSLGFFQGFEIDTSHWFADGNAVVNRVSSPNQSTTYNSGNTSQYGDSPISAASGSFFGRVKSAVSQDSCTIDTSGPGFNSSLLCEGPYTDFGLGFHTAKPFPSGGYTAQLDVYLDVTYASRHPDCGTASPVGAPCTPDPTGTSATLGTVNPACTTNPNGIDCEGSRFTWTVGLNDPSGNFHRDYVFQVGTAPDPHTVGGFGGCTEGYIINAQYNSFRSGGQPYAGFEPKCITTSGWYTFKEVFTQNTSNQLQVDWSILNSRTGTVANCVDTTGTTILCTWSRTLGDQDAISEIGCPRYGWLANEEINDLAIDNTVFNVAPGACGTAAARAQITPTSTTCQQFTSGTASALSQMTYTTKSGTIQSVAPGVFFYYTQLTGSQGDSISISQSHSNAPPPGNISIQNSQAILYSSTCAKIGSLNATDGTASGTLPSTGTFIIGVKYTPSSLAGQKAPTPATDTYTYDTELNNSEVVTATIDLVPRK